MVCIALLTRCQCGIVWSSWTSFELARPDIVHKRRDRNHRMRTIQRERERKLPRLIFATNALLSEPVHVLPSLFKFCQVLYSLMGSSTLHDVHRFRCLTDCCNMQQSVREISDSDQSRWKLETHEQSQHVRERCWC